MAKEQGYKKTKSRKKLKGTMNNKKNKMQGQKNKKRGSC